MGEAGKRIDCMNEVLNCVSTLEEGFCHPGGRHLGRNY